VGFSGKTGWNGRGTPLPDDLFGAVSWPLHDWRNISITLIDPNHQSDLAQKPPQEESCKYLSVLGRK